MKQDRLFLSQTDPSILLKRPAFAPTVGAAFLKDGVISWPVWPRQEEESQGGEATEMAWVLLWERACPLESGTANFCWHRFLPLQRRGTEIVLEVVNDIANAGSCRDASRVPLWQVQWLGKRPELARPEVPPMWCGNPDGSVGPRKAQNDQLIVLGKFDHDLTSRPNPGTHG